jgi:hypothetical protein
MVRLLVAFAFTGFLVSCKHNPCPDGGRLAKEVTGEGTAEWCEREDEHGNFLKHGSYVMWKRPGMKELEIGFKSGKPDGPWLMWNDEGQLLFEGHCEAGVGTGKWVFRLGDSAKLVGEATYDHAGRPVHKRKYWFIGAGDRLQSETEFHGERSSRVNYLSEGGKESRIEFAHGTEVAFFEYENGREVQRALTPGNTYKDDDWPYDPMSCTEMFASVKEEMAKARAKKSPSPGPAP